MVSLEAARVILREQFEQSVSMYSDRCLHEKEFNQADDDVEKPILETISGDSEEKNDSEAKKEV